MNSGVFISHKLDDPPTEAFLAGLRPELEALEKCHVWIDTDIAAGEIWRQELSTWMSLCSCAVLLISKLALQSDWIFQEASILSWRQEQDGNFKLFPVVLDGVTDEEIGKSRLKVVLEILRLQSPGRNGTAAEKLSATTEAVKKHLLARHVAKDEFSTTARAIAQLLKDTPDDALDSAMDYLKVKSGSWVPGWDPKLEFALKLLSVPPLQMRDALDKLEVLPRIKGGIGKLALPFWVDAGAARVVCRSALMASGRPLILLNAAYGETAGDYVTRATFSPSRTWICHQFSNVFGEDFEGELWDEICACIARSMGEEISPQRSAKLRDFAESAILLDTEDSRQFVAMDIRNLRNPDDWAKFEKLRCDHGGLVYLLLTGPELPPESEWTGTAAVPLEPGITADMEKCVHGLRGKFRIYCNQ